MVETKSLSGSTGPEGAGIFLKHTASSLVRPLCSDTEEDNATVLMTDPHGENMSRLRNRIW